MTKLCCPSIVQITALVLAGIWITTLAVFTSPHPFSPQCSPIPTGGPVTEQPEGLGPDNGGDQLGIARAGNFRQLEEQLRDG